MTTVTIRAGVDAYTDATKATTNYASSKSLAIKSATQYGWVFLNPKIPAKATVLSATLRLYVKGQWGASAVTVSAQRIAASWKVSQVNGSNQPSVTGVVASAVVPASTGDGTVITLDVTSIMQTIASGATNYGLRISSNSAVSHSVYSLESATFRPELDVIWSDAPDKPTSLAPASGQAVGIPKPVLRFDYTDVSGSTQLAAVQVQIDALANWTTPGFDSGAVATSDPELNLANTAYVGLNPNASTQWRVRVQDAAGLWSPWSDALSFTYTTKGVLTLTNPAAAPNNLVNDWTPPIDWTFTGRTQQAYRIVVAEDATPTKYLFDSGKVQSTATELTLPPKVLTKTGTTYRVTLFVWDTISRENTPGDAPYVSVVRAFTFAEGAATPITNLVAQQAVAGRPWATLTWNRATQPDSYTVLRDGVVVASGLDPQVLFQSGTSYAYTDKDGAGNVPHTWNVHAVVNGKSSGNNPAVTFTMRSPAVWLTDTSSDKAVPIVGVDSSSFAGADIAGNYEPVGSDSVVRIVQAQRGLEGSLTGRLTDYAGGTASAWEANLIYMKRRPSLELRLTIGSQSFRVVIGDVVIAPVQGTLPSDRVVSFAFWSLDGPP
jgi:hypothetical protein